MNSERNKRNLRYSAIISSFLFIPICGAIDYFTGSEIGFSIFYLLPIMLVTWLSGGKAGVIAALASGTVWVIADMQSGQFFSHPAINYWNGSVRVGFFFIIVFLIARLRKFNQDLEIKVEKRTRELSESEQRYRDLVENSQDLIVTHDLDGVVLSANAAAAQTMGFEEAEVIGKKSKTSWSPGTALALKGISELCARKEKPEARCPYGHGREKREYWNTTTPCASKGLPIPSCGAWRGM